MATSIYSSFQHAHFDQTHWNLVLKAARPDDSGAAALNLLCRCYRKPLYSFVLHRGFSPPDAEDIVQGFFHELLRRNGLQHVDQAKGRFRTFLIKSIKNYLANQWDRNNAKKRGGGCKIVSLDEPEAEPLYAELAQPQVEADKVFDRAWARALLDRITAELRDEYSQDGRLATFEALHSVLDPDGHGAVYADVARKLGTKETAARMAASRLWRRFGKLLRREIRRTVADPAEVKDELRYLLSCL